MSAEGLQVVCSESLAHLPRVSTSRCTELDGPIGTLKVGPIVVKGGGFPLFRVAKRDVKSFVRYIAANQRSSRQTRSSRAQWNKYRLSRHDVLQPVSTLAGDAESQATRSHGS